MAVSRTSWSKGHGPSHKWKPGQSGNPAGRKPLIDDIHALARQHAPEAMQALVDALRDPDRAIPAAVAILDRGYGRPPQAIYAQMNGIVVVGSGIDAPPRETLEQWLERRRKTLAALDGPRREHAPGESAPPPSPPNGAPSSAHAPERSAGQPSTPGGAGPSMSPERERWLQQERRRLGLDPDDSRPNPTLPRR
jgi:hypothetical protein